MIIIDNTVTGVFQNASVGGVAGRYPVIDETRVGMWDHFAALGTINCA